VEKGKRKLREFNLRKTAILEQAAKIFAEKGFHKTTVAEIAGASGFAVGTFYHFFESKEQLYTMMITKKLDMLYSGIQEQAAKETDLLKKIEGMVHTHFQFVEDNAAFCRIFVRGDHLSLSEGRAKLWKQMMTDYGVHLAFVEGVMREGIRASIFKGMDPALMAAAFTGIINSCTSKWLTMAEETTLQSAVPLVTEIFLKGVRADVH
jgi:TetR/AcrR family transcriptional regulator, fatty acid metabolism regulator protein